MTRSGKIPNTLPCSAVDENSVYTDRWKHGKAYKSVFPSIRVYKLFFGPAAGQPRNTLLLLFAALCFWGGYTTPARGQEPAPPVNGGWPAGLAYTVQAGDTLLSVSVEMGLDLAQMGCLLHRSFAWDQPLVIGQTLTVPANPFICHRVQPGDTLAAIAARYGVPVQALIADRWNLTGASGPIRFLRIPLHADPRALAAAPESSLLLGGTGGETIPAPESQLPLPADWPYGSGHFAWPVYGWITQSYRTGHSGLDIGAWAGTPVTAADRGVVIRAGWSNAGYGNFVVIDHKIDYLTLYAHLSEILVVEGQVVAQGQLIGRVGSTGNSTGPHLHFEVRDFGQRVDPLGLLAR